MEREYSRRGPWPRLARYSPMVRTACWEPHTRCGLGFALPPSLGVPSGRRSFGHPGAGGSLGFADPDEGVAFGYAPNRMGGVAVGDARTTSLVEALYRCL